MTLTLGRPEGAGSTAEKLPDRRFPHRREDRPSRSPSRGRYSLLRRRSYRSRSPRYSPRSDRFCSRRSVDWHEDRHSYCKWADRYGHSRSRADARGSRYSRSPPRYRGSTSRRLFRSPSGSRRNSPRRIPLRRQTSRHGSSRIRLSPHYSPRHSYDPRRSPSRASGSPL